MSGILNKVNLQFSLDDIKRIMKLMLLNNSEIMNGYDAMRKVVNDNGDIQNYDEFILLFFKTYVERLSSINIESITDENLKNDYMIIKKSSVLQNPSSVTELFRSNEFQSLKYKPINLQGDFTHIHGSYIGNFAGEEIECRFYMSPKMENITQLIKYIIIKHNMEELPCYFKFSKDSKRNDRIVFYSSLKNAERHLQILEAIKKEKPELFEGSNKNPLWGNINGTSDIYFGIEPFNRGYDSYGSIRGRILDQSLECFKRLYGEINSDDEITDEMAIKFKELLDFNCIIAGVNQNNFALNKVDFFKISSDYGEVMDSMIKLGIDKKEENIHIMLGDFKDKTAIVSWKYKGFNTIDLRLPIEEIDLLYKRDESDPLYSESERVRNKVANEFVKIRKKQNIQNKLDKVNIKKRIAKKRIVQRDLSGNVFMGGDETINYTLYMLLPYKVCKLIVKLKKQYKNIKKYNVDPELAEEISTLNNEISDFSSDDIERVIDIVHNDERYYLNSEEMISDDVNMYDGENYGKRI